MVSLGDLVPLGDEASYAPLARAATIILISRMGGGGRSSGDFLLDPLIPSLLFLDRLLLPYEQYVKGST